jgi:hypothetical protein
MIQNSLFKTPSFILVYGNRGRILPSHLAEVLPALRDSLFSLA